MSASRDTTRSPLDPSATSRRIAAFLIILYASIAFIPMVLIVSTAFKSVTDAISYPPKIISEPSLEGFVNLFTQRTRQSAEYLETLPPPKTWYEEIVRKRNMVIAGPSRFIQRFVNSIIIGFGATFFSVFFGDHCGICLFQVSNTLEKRPSVFCPVNTHVPSHCSSGSDLFNVQETWLK